MKKILIKGMSPNLAGTETFIITYYRNLDSSKFKIDFLVNTEEKIIFEDEILSKGSKIYRLPRKGKNIVKYYEELDYLFKSIGGEYDTFWLNEMSLVNLDYLIYAKKYGIPKRIIHSHSANWGGNILRRFFHEINKRRLTSVATDYFACSEVAADYMFEPKIRSKAVVINNAIEVERFLFNETKRNEVRAKLGWENNKVIGNIGRLAFQKNQPFLIDVFNEAYKSNNNLRLLLLGAKTVNDSTEKEIQDKIDNYGLEEVVKLAGSQRDMQGWLSAMDVYIMTSRYEGLPLSAVEAQANGLPCILADTITTETQINQNVEFLSLNDSLKLWGEKINKHSQENRVEKNVIFENFDQKGFDIKLQVKNIERILND